MDAVKVDRIEKQLDHHLNNGNCSKCSVKGKDSADCINNLYKDALSVIRELKEENEWLKYEKEKAVRDIGLYIADAEEDAKTPSRIGKGYYVGERNGLQIAKDIVEGIRNHG